MIRTRFILPLLAAALAACTETSPTAVATNLSPSLAAASTQRIVTTTAGLNLSVITCDGGTVNVIGTATTVTRLTENRNRVNWASSTTFDASGQDANGVRYRLSLANGFKMQADADPVSPFDFFTTEEIRLISQGSEGNLFFKVTIKITQQPDGTQSFEIVSTSSQCRG